MLQKKLLIIMKNLYVEKKKNKIAKEQKNYFFK